jgi:hypothetical protein
VLEEYKYKYFESIDENVCENTNINAKAEFILHAVWSHFWPHLSTQFFWGPTCLSARNLMKRRNPSLKWSL